MLVFDCEMCGTQCQYGEIIYLVFETYHDGELYNYKLCEDCVKKLNEFMKEYREGIDDEE